ncbi:hypothetical protein Poly30_06500 [Planctomycetes bacterium Poly30]|uniref:DUF4331 domain-containing protein n=1 Tax=Saltatorellus ferox TaxID=2528018 RepID=A0A518EM42_9BACT|nr:hypothetical protein Poly30_06500 [Planctomycetes bacterium Poly30]
MGAWTASASNHREAPITALDHKADITDLYAFVSYDSQQVAGETPEKVTMILNVDPFLEPANGPTLFPFDPAILYEIKIDNDHDAIADVVFQFRFTTEYRIPDLYTAVAGIGANGAANPTTGAAVVPPQITSFQSAGLNLRQSYTVDMLDVATGNVTPITGGSGAPFYACPANVGPRTMNYESLFQEATYTANGGISVFAGTVDDPFYIDLGAAFDTANFRTLRSGIPGVLTSFEDVVVNQNLAPDMVSGFAVNSIAIEVPIAMLTSTGMVMAPTSPEATIGVWGTTSRQRMTVRSAPNPAVNSGAWSQIQRVGNPLINELIIGIGNKDRFSMDEPLNDMQFAGYFLDPPIVGVVEALYGGALAVPAAPRTDLLPLVTYAPPIAAAGTPSGPVADLLRLNTGVSATPPAQQKRMAVLAGDNAGFPNGRRPIDDVTDIALRVVVGGVLAAPFSGYNADVNGRLGDGVMWNQGGYRSQFPYMQSCPSGRNRRHLDPGEVGAGVRD